MFQNAVPYDDRSSDSDEEPVTKQPRLSRGRSRGSGAESSGQSARSARIERAKRVAGPRSEYCDHPVSNERTNQSDSDAFSENLSVGEGSYFEVREFIGNGTDEPVIARSRSGDPLSERIETLPLTVTLS